MLFDILSDIVKIDDVLLIVRNKAAVSEIRSNSLSVRKKENWITIGENEGPAHMHIDSELIKSCEFVRDEKPDRTSYSIRFHDENAERVLGAFFIKMYDENKNLKLERLKIYDQLNQKFGSKIKF